MANALTRALFRGVLKEARAFDAAVLAHGAAVNLPRELARIERCLDRPLSQLCVGESPSATRAASRAFRREVAGGGADVDLAFAAIRWLAARSAQLQRTGWQPKPAHVLLSVGECAHARRAAHLASVREPAACARRSPSLHSPILPDRLSMPLRHRRILPPQHLPPQALGLPGRHRRLARELPGRGAVADAARAV
jgi:hypothetical protein